MKLPRPEFPLVWDNTMRSSFVNCPQKCVWEYWHHYKPLHQSIDLHAGAAWAKGLEAARRAYYCDGHSPDESEGLGLIALLRAYGDFDPGDSPKSKERLSEAFAYYFTHFPLASDPAKPYVGHTGPMIEFSFALPLDEKNLLHPVTGEPIIYSGRADMIATFAGAVTVYDDKTTKSLGATWPKQWDLRSQFSGYAWAAQQYGIHVTQCLVRGIAILKTQFNHMQALPTRPQYAVDRWHQQCVRDISRAISAWKEGYYDLALDEACNAYGGCMFRQPCMSRDSEAWITGGNYAQRVWNPLTRLDEEPAK